MVNRDPIAVVGVSHHTAPIAVRERFAFPPEIVRRLLESIDGEAMLLTTCNRTELYGLADAASLTRRLREAADVQDDGSLYRYTADEAARHLFSVAAGLDSMVVGEPQILGQVKRAMRDAREVGTLGPVLDELCRRGLTVGRRVRKETAVGEGLPSIPKVATGMARLVLGELEGRTMAVVGTGELGRLTAELLARAGAASIVVTNRTPEPARELAERVGGRTEPFDRLDTVLTRADVVITCTASQKPLLTRDRIEKILRDRDGRMLVVVDIAIPRDVEADVRSMPGVRLYDLDDLRGWGSTAVAPEALEAARAIVEEEASEFTDWRAERTAVPTIRALHARAAEILHRELERVSPEEEEAMRRFGRRILRKVLHEPVVRLREGVAREGEEYIDRVWELFDLDGEPPPDALDLDRNGPAGERDSA